MSHFFWIYDMFFVWREGDKACLSLSNSGLDRCSVVCLDIKSCSKNVFLLIKSSLWAIKHIIQLFGSWKYMLTVYIFIEGYTVTLYVRAHDWISYELTRISWGGTFVFIAHVSYQQSWLFEMNQGGYTSLYNRGVLKNSRLNGSVY